MKGFTLIELIIVIIIISICGAILKSVYSDRAYAKEHGYTLKCIQTIGSDTNGSRVEESFYIKPSAFDTAIAEDALTIQDSEGFTRFLSGQTKCRGMK